MAKIDKNTEIKSKDSATAVETMEEVRVTPAQLAEMLAQNSQYELQAGKKLVVHNMNLADFLNAVSATDHAKRLQVVVQMLANFGLEVSMEGSITIGEFNMLDHSWALLPGESGSLKISSKPVTLVRSITDLVGFLNRVAVGSGFPLKPSQDLFLTGFSPESLLEYYQLCQETEDAAAREQGQDALFAKACQTLGLKGLMFNIYGINAAQVSRSIDVNVGGIFFRALATDEKVPTGLMIALVDQK